MFVHNLNPVLVSIGFIEIRWYSLAYIIGFLIAYYVLLESSKKKEITNLTKEAVEDFTVYLILGIVIGGRLGHFIFYNPSVFWTNPLEILFIWHGGMAFHGGLIGAIIGFWLFRKKHRIDFYELADKLMIPLAFALFLGRITNFINGELWGPVTDVAWCVEFGGLCRHPSQLYEAAYSLAIMFALLGMNKYREWSKGVIFWTFIILYGTLRFLANFLREDPRFLGISMGQFLSLVMVGVAVYFLRKSKERN